MENSERNKSDRDIIENIKEAHKIADKKTENQDTPNKPDSISGDLNEQIKGSDADHDQQTASGDQEEIKQEQIKGSDADQD